MSGSYRGVGIAALIAALLIAFGLGAYTFSLGYPEKIERYPSYQQGYSDNSGASSSVPNIPQGIVQKSPCNNPQSETESDLCAQWRAAKAAEKAADWTVYGVLASITGISLLLWQINLTREAVEDTGKATIAMERQNEIAERQQRPWVTVAIADAFMTQSQGGLLLVCDVSLGNIGATPAFKASISHCIGPAFRSPIWDFQTVAENVDAADYSEDDESLIILPNGSTQSQIFIHFARNDPRHPFDDGIVPVFMVWVNYSLPNGCRAHSSAWFTVTPKNKSDIEPLMFSWDDEMLDGPASGLDITDNGYVRVT
ncbi:hypothetical protein [Blastomonas aquatica]|uniref:Uncharacterized protein n=1 Tax=Blastomonas aquatica TaxID=1510276 RepID=A0ABQ1IWA9_9SPHN|nr:hypothetical protein [Blastomonas aquatica]GGB52063.1 hypothetical protein GCM10010833_03510 [Blastomonas aquatica]